MQAQESACAASQADVLVPQGYGTILAQIIIKKPHRSKGFIKQNMSWAFGSSCPQSGKHTLKSGSRQTLYPLNSSAISANWQGLS